MQVSGWWVRLAGVAGREGGVVLPWGKRHAILDRSLDGATAVRRHHLLPGSAMPHDASARLRDSWTTNADAWTAAVREGRIASRRLVTDAAIVDAVAARAPRRVLDVGCGEGWLARALAERGMAVVGIDVSAPLVAAARETRPPGADLDFRVLDYASLAADPARAGGPFDVAVCNFALLDADVVPLLAALRACLAPGGAVVIQTVHPWTARGDAPYVDGWRTETFAGFGDGFSAAMPWYYRTLTSWLAALHDAGLTLERLAEPLHPETGMAASLVLVGVGGGG